MKIEIISDIHLEFYTNKKIDFSHLIKNTENADLLILAGDIGFPENKIYENFLDYVSKEYQNIILITGNHEYYSTLLMSEIDYLIQNIVKKYDNIHFLNNKTVIINNINFIGTTMWCNVEDDNNKYINDVRKIFINDKNLLAQPKDFRKLFEENTNFIENNINQEMKNIVITHHMPSFKCIDEKYKNGGKLNNWFASDCEYILEKNKNINYWICGHTHSNIDLELYNTRILCNPLGYPTFFRKKIIFENENHKKLIIDCQ